MTSRSIRKQRRWLSAEDIRLLAIGLFLLAVMLIGNIALARVLPGGEWFFQRWSGTRAFLVEVIEFSNGVKAARVMPEGTPDVLDAAIGPYTTELAQRTQEIVYGRRAFSSEYTYVLNDPFFILLLYSPLALISDFVLARGVWMLLCELALIGTVLLSINLSEWQPRRWLYVLLLVFGLIQYFSLNALVTATPAIFLGFLYVCILFALRSHSDELAGILLALVAYQWEVGGLFFLFVIFFVFFNRRWGVLAGLAMALFVLLAISFLTNSGWGLPYIRAALSAWYRGENLTLGHILSTWIPNLRFPAGPVVAIALGILLFIEWWDAADAHFRQIVWTAALSLAATPLIGFPIFSSNHVVLILPFVLVLALVWERWPRYRTLRVVLLFVLVLGIPFTMYYRVVTVYDPLMIDLISVVPPLAAILGLYWMRWWVLRPPRTLFERFGDRA
jgi:hypothetical protein